MPSFHRGVLHSSLSLSIRGPLGTDVPTATPGQQYFLSPPLRDTSYDPTTAHGWHRAYLCASHIRHTSTTTHLQGAMPFILPRYGQPRVRRGDTLGLTWGAPCKQQKPKARTFREAWQEAFSKDSEVVKVAQWTYHKAHNAIFEQEGSYDLTSMFLEMVLYNVLLINRYIGNITTKCHNESMSDNRDPTVVLHQEISTLPVSIASDIRCF